MKGKRSNHLKQGGIIVVGTAAASVVFVLGGEVVLAGSAAGSEGAVVYSTLGGVGATTTQQALTSLLVLGTVGSVLHNNSDFGFGHNNSLPSTEGKGGDGRPLDKTDNGGPLLDGDDNRLPPPPNPNMSPEVAAAILAIQGVSTAKPNQSNRPRNSTEQILWNSVKENPTGVGRDLDDMNNDPRFSAKDGFQKMSTSGNSPL